jgi:hypothetical protein
LALANSAPVVTALGALTMRREVAQERCRPGNKATRSGIDEDDAFVTLPGINQAAALAIVLQDGKTVRGLVLYETRVQRVAVYDDCFTTFCVGRPSQITTFVA